MTACQEGVYQKGVLLLVVVLVVQENVGPLVMTYLFHTYDHRVRGSRKCGIVGDDVPLSHLRSSRVPNHPLPPLL